MEKEDFITGADLRKRWKDKPHRLWGKVTATKNGLLTFCKALRPYSPADRKPYECWNPLLLDAHRRAGTQYEPKSYEVKQPGDIYESLDKALFRLTDVEAFEKANQPERINRNSGAGEASREKGEWTLKAASKVLEKCGGISGYKALPRGKKKTILEEIGKAVKAKDLRNVHNLLKKLELSIE